MKLKQTLSSECPTCGCSTVVNEGTEIDTDGSVRQHCNGERWDYRTFICGHRVKWIPNYSKEMPMSSYPCKKDPKYIERQRKRKMFDGEIEVLREQIRNLNSQEL